MPTPKFDTKALAPLVRQALLAKMAGGDDGPARVAPKQEGVGKWPHIVHAAGNMADGLSSYRVLNDPRYDEANPLLPNHGGAVLGIKAASILPEALLMRFLAKKGHPKIAKGLGYLLGGAGGAAALHNIRNLRKDR